MSWLTLQEPQALRRRYLLFVTAVVYLKGKHIAMNRSIVTRKVSKNDRPTPVSTAVSNTTNSTVMSVPVRINWLVARNAGCATIPVNKSLKHRAPTRVFDGTWSERVFISVTMQIKLPTIVIIVGMTSMNPST